MPLSNHDNSISYYPMQFWILIYYFSNLNSILQEFKPISFYAIGRFLPNIYREMFYPINTIQIFTILNVWRFWKLYPIISMAKLWLAYYPLATCWFLLPWFRSSFLTCLQIISSKTFIRMAKLYPIISMKWMECNFQLPELTKLRPYM